MARDISRLPTSAAGEELRNSLTHRKILDPQPAPAADEKQRQLHREPKPCRCLARWHRRGRTVRSARGVVTHDAGLTRQRTKGRRFDPGMAFRAQATLLAEGTHGLLSRQAVAMYGLRHGTEAQTYEIGIKEVWHVEEGRQSTHPRPCTPRVAAGGTIYHMADGLVSISLVVGLDHKIPYIELDRVFQQRVRVNQLGLALSNSTIASATPT
ncbi:hypothetical protein K438DRAFT_1783800 [Mycena galopus ATCC 62051]|nr:hypothetical protein K438DRAFT_1783800 [Mycena galopus ATCC 62051]